MPMTVAVPRATRRSLAQDEIMRLMTQAFNAGDFARARRLETFYESMGEMPDTLFDEHE